MAEAVEAAERVVVATEVASRAVVMAAVAKVAVVPEAEEMAVALLVVVATVTVATVVGEQVVAVMGVVQAAAVVGVEMAVEACTTRWSTRAPRQSHSPCRSMKPPPMHHTGACLARGTRETPLRTGLRSC